MDFSLIDREGGLDGVPSLDLVGLPATVKLSGFFFITQVPNRTTVATFSSFSY